MTKISPLLPPQPSLTNKSFLLKIVGDLKSGQCKTILDWMSEDAEVSFRLILQSCHVSLSIGTVPLWGLRLNLFCACDAI